MNILQVNFSDLIGHIFNGYDLHLSLNQMGINANQVVRDKRSNQSSVLELKKDVVLQHQIRQFEKEYSISNLIFPYGEELRNLQEYKTADIVHYHIMHNGMVSLLDYPILMNEKKAVWTIHDPWILTGNCVHPLSCEKWKSGCKECDRLDEIYFEMNQDNTSFMWNVKKEILSQVNPHIIVSCDFMKKYIQESPLTQHFTNIHTIPFGLKIEKYDLSTKEYSRNNKTVIGFRCEDAQIKGCNFIYEALRLLEDKSKFVIYCVGSGNVPKDIQQSFEIHELGWVDEEEKMIEFLLRCDIFLMPSLAETFGLMAIEAMAAGAVVISFKGTVLEEITSSPDVGISVEYKSYMGIYEAIRKLDNNPSELRVRGIRGHALVKEKYTFNDYVNKHRLLYESIVYN